MARRHRYNDNIVDVEKQLQDKMTLWILRILINLNGHKKFIDKDNYFDQDEIALYLGFEKYIDMKNDEYSRTEIINILKSKLNKLEKRKRFTTVQTLKNNIKQLSKLMGLNVFEEQILEFAIIIHQYDILDDSADFIGNELNTKKVKSVLSVILDIPKEEVTKAFHSNSILVKSSILIVDKDGTNCLKRKLEPISDQFFDNMLSLDEDISVMIKDSVRVCQKSDLKLEDYSHIQKEMDILIPYLQNAISNNQNGVNILLYGLPGTGKTELSKAIASKLNTKLFEISYANEDDEAIDGEKRLKAYKTAQALLSNQNTLLMYDEAEDIFDSNDSPFVPKRQTDKAWINRILETNKIPTIWITNNIYSIDNAMVRRFDMSIEMPIPSKSKREDIIKKYTHNILDKNTIKKLSANEDIAPALISRTAKVVNNIDVKDKDKVFTQILNNTLKAQGYNEIKENITNSLPSLYNPNFINTTTNLDDLTNGIKQSQNARICLYGAAGTGKSQIQKRTKMYLKNLHYVIIMR